MIEAFAVQRHLKIEPGRLGHAADHGCDKRLWHLFHDSAEEIQGVSADDLLDVFVGMAPADQAADDVLAIGRGFQAVQIRGWHLFQAPAQHIVLEHHVVADDRVGPDAHVVHADQLDHVVVVVQYALDVLLRVVAEGVGHGGDADQSSLGGAGL